MTDIETKYNVYVDGEKIPAESLTLEVVQDGEVNLKTGETIKPQVVNVAISTEATDD